ncbi:MAG: hypothetical protein MUC88_20425 [Planctomycetes bacterium]|jgi:hypothetical protein|nr:hypothetical protein [Planctomycetota bacterium]
MAKSEGRGWRKFMPSVATIVKVFVALVVIKAVSSAIANSVPASLRPYYPVIA